MAARQVVPAHEVREVFLNPLTKVKDFFEALAELRSASKTPSNDSRRYEQSVRVSVLAGFCVSKPALRKKTYPPSAKSVHAAR